MEIDDGDGRAERHEGLGARLGPSALASRRALCRVGARLSGTCAGRSPTCVPASRVPERSRRRAPSGTARDRYGDHRARGLLRRRLGARRRGACGRRARVARGRRGRHAGRAGPLRAVAARAARGRARPADARGAVLRDAASTSSSASQEAEPPELAGLLLDPTTRASSTRSSATSGGWPSSRRRPGRSSCCWTCRPG